VWDNQDGQRVKLIDEILAELERSLKKINRQRDRDGVPALRKIEIRLLGQFSLLVDRKVSGKIPLAATRDLDALIKAEFIVERELKTILEKKGLVLDDLSGEIWVPDEGQFIVYYESPMIRCVYLDPVSVLVSKAIKAKEKNRFLIRDAIAVFGEGLVKLIRKYGGNPEYFIQDDDDQGNRGKGKAK